MVKGNMIDIHMFHAKRGSVYGNMSIDELLDCFQIKHSQRKDDLYGNVATKSAFKTIKVKFVTRAALIARAAPAGATRLCSLFKTKFIRSTWIFAISRV
jgi:hypothetical protein